MKEEEQSRSVGGFPLARVQARLSEERRLLIARRPGDRDDRPAAAQLPHLRIRIAYLGKDGARNGKAAQEIFVPRHRMDVEEHGAGGVRDVRYKGTPLRQLEDEIAVDRAGAKLPFAKELSDERNMLKIPDDLARRKIGVRHQSRALAHQSFGLLVERGAPVARAAALPADGGADGLARFAVPHDDCFALIGYADPRNVFCSRKTQAVVEHIRAFEVYFVRILFHPSRAREALPDFLLRAVNERFFPDIVHECAHACRARVESDHIFHPVPPLPE